MEKKEVTRYVQLLSEWMPTFKFLRSSLTKQMGKREAEVIQVSFESTLTIPTIGRGDSIASFEDCALEKLYFEGKAIKKVFYWNIAGLVGGVVI